MKNFTTFFCLLFILGNSIFAQDFPDTQWVDFADTSWYNETDDTYEITTAESLAGLSVLVADGTSFEGKTIDILEDIDLGEHLFQPIGTDIDHAFTGTVMGNNHVISNLKINQNNKDFVGLFGAVLNSEFYNIFLDNAVIHGGSTVGALVANLSTNSHMEFCHVTNSVVKCQPGFYGGIGGGLVGGLLSGSSIKLSSFSGDVFGGDQIGGLVGTSWDTTLIEQSYSEGLVQGDNIVGGLVGYTTMNFPPFPNTTNIVRDCFSASDVVATGERAGGLFGYPETNALIENSYSIGTVEGEAMVGASIGAITGDTQVINTYFDLDTTGMTEGIGEYNGPFPPEIIGMNTADMKTEDFANTLNVEGESVWYQDDNMNDGYPFFSGMFLAVNEPQLQKDEISIYPTLSYSQIFVDTDVKANFMIVNMLGGVNMKGSLDTGNNSVDISPLTPGVYIFVFNTDNGRTVKRFIKR